MALTQSDLEALDAAIASSELEVEFKDGRRVRYRSTDDLMKARGHVATVLAGQAGSPAQGTRTFMFDFRTRRGD